MFHGLSWYFRLVICADAFLKSSPDLSNFCETSIQRQAAASSPKRSAEPRVFSKASLTISE